MGGWGSRVPNFLVKIQGVSFNWYPPKNHKYGKKFKYQNWYPPKIHKYVKKLKYQNWYPPQMHKYQLIRRLTMQKADCQLGCRL